MKISLNQQLEEVERELGERKTVYARIASSHPSKRSQLDYQMARMQAVRDTLVWLRDNRTRVLEEVRKEAANEKTAPAREGQGEC